MYNNYTKCILYNIYNYTKCILYNTYKVYKMYTSYHWSIMYTIHDVYFIHFVYYRYTSRGCIYSQWPSKNKPTVLWHRFHYTAWNSYCFWCKLTDLQALQTRASPTVVLKAVTVLDLKYSLFSYSNASNVRVSRLLHIIHCSVVSPQS